MMNLISIRFVSARCKFRFVVDMNKSHIVVGVVEVVHIPVERSHRMIARIHTYQHQVAVTR